MQYTLITPDGEKITFYIKEVAELYKSIRGGIIVETAISVDKRPEVAV